MSPAASAPSFESELRRFAAQEGIEPERLRSIVAKWIPQFSVVEAMEAPGIFGPVFRPPEIWQAWRAFLSALFGLPLNEDEMELFRECTGRTVAPASPCREAWVVVGRRGGKSRIVALIAVFLALFRDYSNILAPGERGIIAIIAPRREQAKKVLRYVKGLLGISAFARMVETQRSESIDLVNNVTIQITTASTVAVRGETMIAAILEEVAFWPTDNSADPDTEILAALRPAMGTVPTSLLVGISSPYSRRGVLWDHYYQHHGKDDSPVLVWQAPTLKMNKVFDRAIVERAYDEDPTAAAAEYGAEFREDIERFIPPDLIDKLVVQERKELLPREKVRYVAFTDPAGGNGGDSFTLAIGHLEKRDDGPMVVVDCIREVKPRFSPEKTTEDFCALLRTYKVSSVTGDNYAGEWPKEQFRKHGVSYKQSPKVKKHLYRDALPAMNSGRVELLDEKVLSVQFKALERRTGFGGQDSIDHPPNGHDDVANSVAGLIDMLMPSSSGDFLKHVW